MADKMLKVTLIRSKIGTGLLAFVSLASCFPIAGSVSASFSVSVFS